MFVAVALLAQSGLSALFADSISEPSDVFESPSCTPFLPTDPNPTHQPNGVQLTETQQIIVYGSISLTAILIAAEAATTVYCRRKNRRRIPVELEQVMLPAPDDAYGLEPL
jgi:hypothetical protein